MHRKVVVRKNQVSAAIKLAAEKDLLANKLATCEALVAELSGTIRKLEKELEEKTIKYAFDKKQFGDDKTHINSVTYGVNIVDDGDIDYSKIELSEQLKSYSSRLFKNLHKIAVEHKSSRMYVHISTFID